MMSCGGCQGGEPQGLVDMLSCVCVWSQTGVSTNCDDDKRQLGIEALDTLSYIVGGCC